MKIKVLLADPQALHDLPPEAIGLFGLFKEKPLDAYIELDTGGGLFDTLPSETQVQLQKCAGAMLRGFACSLVSAFYLDMATRAGPEAPGQHAITSALYQIEAQLDELRKSLPSKGSTEA